MSPKLTPLCLALSLLLVPFIGVLQVKGAEPGLDLLDEESEDDFLTQLEQGEGNDYDLLQHSHLSELHRWEGVKRSRRHKGEDFRWRVIVLKDYPGRNLIKPVNGKTITDRIRVPESRAYRIWLGYLAGEKATPVEVKMSGANSHVFKYGAKDLPRKPGKTLEAERPIRFDSERERMASAVSAKNMIWEYRDVSLEAGTTRLSVSSESPRATLDSVFITASRDFSPSKDTLRGNLNRTYVRFRVVESKQETDSTPISERLTYHWYHIPDGHSRPLWYSSLRSWEPDHVKGPLTGRPGERRLPVGEWTRWIDATEALVATGRFATERFSFDDVQEGVAEVQMSWFTHPAATMRSARPRIAEGTAMVTIPVARRGYRAPTAGPEDENGVWGMRADDYLKWVETPTKIQARQRRWADEVLAKLGAQVDNPTPDPRYIKLYTPARPFPPAREETAKMLSRLGINWIHGLPWQVSEKYDLLNGYFTHLGVGLYFADTPCPSDPRTPAVARRKFAQRAKRYDQQQPKGHERVLAMKLGDEIGAVTGAEHINRCCDCLSRFHDYLRRTIKRLGKDPSFLGVKDVTNLR
ncbi:MAG: hypothetical protein KGZ25_14715, partial [Planctomycetes bacterium]|nr:hypothetical protein [Planctomycetota bacterium]